MGDTIPYKTVPYYTILYSTLLYTILYTILYCTVLQYASIYVYIFCTYAKKYIALYTHASYATIAIFELPSVSTTFFKVFDGILGLGFDDLAMNGVPAMMLGIVFQVGLGRGLANFVAPTALPNQPIC